MIMQFDMDSHCESQLLQSLVKDYSRFNGSVRSCTWAYQLMWQLYTVDGVVLEDLTRRKTLMCNWPKIVSQILNVPKQLRKWWIHSALGYKKQQQKTKQKHNKNKQKQTNKLLPSVLVKLPFRHYKICIHMITISARMLCSCLESWDEEICK